MMKRKLLLAILFAISISGHAQTEKSWTPISKYSGVTLKKAVSRLSFPKDFRLFTPDIQQIRQSLQSVPARSLTSRRSGTIISLPNASGSIGQFEIFEASNFEPALQARFPQIRAYIGKGITDRLAVLRMSVDPTGIRTMIFRTDKHNEFMEPYSADGTVYAVFESSRQKGGLPFVCSTQDVAIANDAHRIAAAPQSTSVELLTFRLALSCNGEYTAYFGGEVEDALAGFNASMTRVNGVFEKDFSIHMNIIDNTTDVIYTNASTDPYTNMGAWNGQLQNTLTDVIGEENYDIGHFFGATGGGGNAGCIGCVCEDGEKGSGITSPADAIPEGDNFDIDYVAHEMGHQFGGNHTFSNNVEGTGVNVEPGSGTTIMGYAGITAQDIAAHSDDYFVYASIKQIQDNMLGKTCPVRTPLTNIAPTMNAGADYIIPISTPFVLTGSAIDPNGDPLTYCWEQNDSATTQTGNNSQASPTKTGGPNWRSYNPTTSPSRYFPPLARVVNNQLTSVFEGITTEAVSSVSRVLNFALTGRDNVPGVGQTGTDFMKVTTTSSAGPFIITAPNTNVSFPAGTNQEVTWNVAGTTANGVNAAYVDIFLSNDGGLTYPTQLASKVPNDGAETVTIPNTTGTTGRIMVKGYNHIFYDISNVNFSITDPESTFSVAFSGVAGEQNRTACQGMTVTYTIPYEALNGFSGSTNFTIDGLPAAANPVFSPASASATGNIMLMVTTDGTSPAGFYPLIVTATSGAIIKTVPLYLELFNSGFEALQLTSPSNGATAQSTAITLAWDIDPNATSYDVVLASDEDFTNIISSETVTTNSYLALGLDEATFYYWKVLPKNISCEGVFSEVFSFQTGQVACNSISSPNVPVEILESGANTINSTLIIAAGAGEIISDLNMTMNVTHTWISDLTATLISPAGTQVLLFAGSCGDSDNIAATFDDAGAVFACGADPAISGTIKPSELLSAFNGESSEGVWTLRIEDGFNQDGGPLTAWSLNICSTQELSVAQVDGQLSGFSLYPNPSTGKFNVSFNSKSGRDISIDVYDLRGRKIFSQSYKNTGIFDQSLEIGKASSGIYLVNVDDGITKESRKIVIE